MSNITDVSRYKNNLLASRKKHLYSRLLDYFGLFVVTYIVFTIFYSISNNFPVMKNLGTRLTNQNQAIAEYIDSTHLQRLTEDKKELLSIDDGAVNYAKLVAKNSAYVHDMDFPYRQEDGTYIDKKVTIEETFVYDRANYPLDDLSYYFKNFKALEPSLNSYVYEGVDYKDDIDTYMYIKAMKLNSSYYVDSDDEDLLLRGEGISNYTVLTVEETEKIIAYYRGDSGGKQTYVNLYTYFINGAKFGIKEVENKSLPYISLTKTYTNIYQELVGALFIVYLVSYTFAYVLLTVIMRLISKEWITMGQKVLGLSLSDINEFEPSVWQIIGYHILNYVFFFSSCAICFYFTGMIGVFSLSIIGKFTLLSLVLAILTLNIISLFFPFFNKNHHDLSTLITRLVVKDTREFEGPIEEPKEEETEAPIGENNGAD